MSHVLWSRAAMCSPTQPKLVGAAALVMLANACGWDLSDPKVSSDRVLAIQTAVTTSLMPDPELDIDRPKAEALPFETVEITPFIVNEHGVVDPDSLDVLWLACELAPNEGLFACLPRTSPLALDEIPECPTPSVDQLLEDELPASVTPCVIGREGIPEYVVPLSANVLIEGSIELTMIAGLPGGIAADECAAEILGGADVPDGCLRAVGRLRVGPIELFSQFAGDLGVELPGVETPDPENIPEPDRNPRISEIRVKVIGGDDDADNLIVIESGAVVQAPLGAQLHVEVDLPAEDLQPFMFPFDEEERQEKYRGSWYQTWGEMISRNSEGPMSYNRWALRQSYRDETKTPPGDRAWLYYVVGDGQMGVDWFSFEVEIVE